METKNQTLAEVLKIGGIVVLVLGILMAGRMFLFPSSPLSYASSEKGQIAASVAVIKGDVQEVTIDLKSGAYAPIVVQKGVPVRFNIRAEQKAINSCNGTVVIPDYNIRNDLKPGDNILEFTPDKSGTIPYSCWMGMVGSSIQVVDDIGSVDPAAIAVPAGGNGFAMPCCQRQQ